MAKLKCKEHGRRVLVIRTELQKQVTVHRSDGTRCGDNATEVTIGTVKTNAYDVCHFYNKWHHTESGEE